MLVAAYLHRAGTVLTCCAPSPESGLVPNRDASGTRQAEGPHPPTDGHGYAVTMTAALDLDRHQEAAPDRAHEDAPCTSEAGRVHGYTVATLPGFGYMVATWPRKAKRPTRESWPKCLNLLVGALGLEPRTN